MMKRLSKQCIESSCHEHSIYSRVLETIGMTTADNLDIRTVTMGINLLPTSDRDPTKLAQNIRDPITRKAKELVQQAGILEKRYGIPIVNKRITVTPISLLLNTVVTENKKEALAIAELIAATLDETAQQLNVDFIGGYGAQVEKGMTYADKVLIESLPTVLNETETVCAFVNVGSTKIGLNMRAITRMGAIIHQTSKGKNGSLSCAKLVVFCNAVSANPFMSGGFHLTDQPDVVLKVGISGPGVGLIVI